MDSILFLETNVFVLSLVAPCIISLILGILIGSDIGHRAAFSAMRQESEDCDD